MNGLVSPLFDISSNSDCRTWKKCFALSNLSLAATWVKYPRSGPALARGGEAGGRTPIGNTGVQDDFLTYCFPPRLFLKGNRLWVGQTLNTMEDLSPGFSDQLKSQSQYSGFFWPQNSLGLSCWGERAAPSKRILNEGSPVIEVIMQLDGLLGSLPLLSVPAGISLLDGKLVRGGSGSLSTRRVRMMRARGLNVPFQGQRWIKGCLCPVVA